MDETRWPMFCQVDGKGRQLHWFWVVVSSQTTVFLLEGTRSGEVPRAFFAKGTQGTVNVDRYSGYFKLLGEDWEIELAYCWSHQRRDFVNLGESSKPGNVWAREWISLINELFSVNARRREVWFGGQKVGGESFAQLDQAVRQQMGRLKARLDLEWAEEKLAGEQKKILRSMRRHWAGLSVFVEKPAVPMDNNAAERALRPLAVGRKNFYGSGSVWSGELASAAFSILATVKQQGVCPRRFLQGYLGACAQNGGRAPEDLEPYLPWNWSAEKRALWQRKERPP
jgi:transposase